MYVEKPSTILKKVVLFSSFFGVIFALGGSPFLEPRYYQFFRFLTYALFFIGALNFPGRKRAALVVLSMGLIFRAIIELNTSVVKFALMQERGDNVEKSIFLLLAISGYYLLTFVAPFLLTLDTFRLWQKRRVG